MNKKLDKKEIICAVAGFFVLVFGVLLFSGALTSGMHLTDDHEYFSYTLQMKRDGMSYLDCLKSTIMTDFSWRFRPLYYFIRITMTTVIGTNLFLWSLIKGMVIVTALTYLYLLGRELRCSRPAAALFSLLTMMGPQAAVWWKLGPQEGTGMMLFAAAFYYLVKWLHQEKRNCYFLSLVLFSLVALYKESFMMLFPFVMLFILIDGFKKNGFSWHTIKSVLKKNWIFITTLMILMIAILLIIFLFIGTQGGFYDENMSPNEYKLLWIYIFQNPLQWFIVFFIPVFVVMLTYLKGWKQIGWEMLLTCAIMIPQVVLHLRLGLYERYIIPWVFGYSFFIVIVMSNWPVLKGIRRMIVYGSLSLLLLTHFVITVKDANYFAYRGKSVTKILETVLAESDKDANILAAFSPYHESGVTVSQWMRYHDRENVYIWDNDKKTSTDQFGEGKGRTGEIADMDFILLYNPQDSHYLYEQDIDLSGFSRTDYGTLTIARKK